MTYIDDVFGPDGLLAAALPGYKVRAGQVELARSIDTVLGEGGVLLAEAPTATGKSLAYGVPAAWHAAHNARRVVIVTANIALQEQLVGKDLPLLARVLPWPFTFALAKGINNYLCNDRLDEATADLLMSSGVEGGPDAQRQWAEIVSWAARTEHGDVSELPFEPLSVVRPRFTTSSDECLGASCPRKVGCHALAARQAAKRAQVVVTNYHLYFADLALKAQGAEGVLPPYDVAVLDEGHKAADIARDFYGSRTTPGALRWATRHLRGRRGIPSIDDKLHAAVQAEGDRHFRALGTYAATDAYYARLRAPSPVAWERLVALLTEAERKLRKASIDLPIPGEKKQELRQAAGKCELHRSSISAAMQLEDGAATIYYIDVQGERVALMSAPIVVADRLRTDLFERVRSVVVTSATLTTSGNFEFLRGELGADGGEELVAESPLDWASQALLVMPGGMPEPNDKGFGNALAESLLDVVRLAGGRTLALFTSYRMLDLAHRRLLAANLPYRILRQGEAPRLALLKQFKEDVSSVLLGTESFWTGVDVPGEACSVVCIDRLPFESPADPLIDAVCEKDRGAFKRFLVPRAILAFRQGVGRLIRNESDRGVVVVFDRRVVDKSYGRSFLRSLPPMKQRRDLEAVREFLHHGHSDLLVDILAP